MDKKSTANKTLKFWKRWKKKQITIVVTATESWKKKWNKIVHRSVEWAMSNASVCDSCVYELNAISNMYKSWK